MQMIRISRKYSRNAYLCRTSRLVFAAQMMMMVVVIMIMMTMYLLTAVGLTPGGSSTLHIHTQTIHRTT